MAITGSCHCGAVSYEFNDTPAWTTKCNCSICRRLGTRWIYSDSTNITVTSPENGTLRYVHGDKELAFRSCKTCGCTILWESADNPGVGRMAVNLNLAEPEVAAKVRVRHFDGADSWEFLD